MSALRIKIGDTWWTGAPGQSQAAHTSAVGFSALQTSKMQMLSGPGFAAQVPQDLRQRAVQLQWSVTRQFETVTAKAAWIANVLSLAPDHDWQEDVILRWEHEDGEGYTESQMPWGALRIGSIAEEGETTLRLSLTALGPELRDHALRARPNIVTEDGRPMVTEDGRPLVGEEFQTVEA